jgi:uncharacterized membrane protein (DUF485 family)
MYDPVHALIHANPKFQQLVRRRERLAWSLSAVMLSLYIAFILLVAFRPDWLGARIRPEFPVTWGIPVGIGLIISAFVLTGIYVHRANGEFDRLTRELLEEVVR